MENIPEKDYEEGLSDSFDLSLDEILDDTAKMVFDEWVSK